MVSYKDFDFFVFDWDGTVLDTISSIICSYQYACKEMGFPVPDDDVVRSTIGLSTEKCLRICCPDCPPERFSEYFGFYTSHYLPREANLQLIDGMETLLRDMHTAGLRLGIATGKSNKGMKRVLTKYGLEGLFESVQTADDNFSKPNPSMLYSISDDSGVECSKMLVIGDSCLDLQMAQNAGASSVAMTYGATKKEDLQKMNPLSLCGSAEELRKFLRL